jgi:hypothetical protein
MMRAQADLSSALGRAYRWTLAAFRQAPSSGRLRSPKLATLRSHRQNFRGAQATNLRGDAAAQRNVWGSPREQRATPRNCGNTESSPRLFDYINFQIKRGNLLAAQRLGRILELTCRLSGRSRPYLDALIHYKDLVRLQDAWAVLAQHFPNQIGHGTRTRISLQMAVSSTTSEWGLDWRVIHQEAIVTLIRWVRLPAAR